MASDAARDAFVAEGLRNSPVVRGIRSVLVAGINASGDPAVIKAGKKQYTSIVLDLYLKAVHAITHRLRHETGDTGTQDALCMAVGAFSASARSLGLRHFLTAGAIEELWEPFMRGVPCFKGNAIGVDMLSAAPLADLPSATAITVLRVLGETLATPWIDPDIRTGAFHFMFVVSTGCNESNALADHPTARATAIHRLHRAGSAWHIVRFTAQSLLPDLSAAARFEQDGNRNDVLLLLVSAVAAALSGGGDLDDISVLLEDLETAVVAHSPWVWKELARFGTEWAAGHERQTLVCAPTAFLLFAASGPKAYAAAVAAGGEALLGPMVDHLLATTPAGGPGGGPVKETYLYLFRQAKTRPDFDFVQWTVFQALPVTCLQVQTALVRHADRVAEAGGPAAWDLQRRELRAEAERAAAEKAAQRVTGSQTCACCGQRGEKMKLCSGCRHMLETRYCSSACQHAHWRVHKKACKAAQQTQ